jgi:hypothetical protein
LRGFLGLLGLERAPGVRPRLGLLTLELGKSGGPAVPISGALVGVWPRATCRGGTGGLPAPTAVPVAALAGVAVAATAAAGALFWARGHRTTAKWGKVG